MRPTPAISGMSTQSSANPRRMYRLSPDTIGSIAAAITSAAIAQPSGRRAATSRLRATSATTMEPKMRTTADGVRRRRAVVDRIPASGSTETYGTDGVRPDRRPFCGGGRRGSDRAGHAGPAFGGGDRRPASSACSSCSPSARSTSRALTLLGVGILLAFALEPLVKGAQRRLRCSRAIAVSIVGAHRAGRVRRAGRPGGATGGAPGGAVRQRAAADRARPLRPAGDR